MRYDLKSAQLQRTFYIECRLMDRPPTMGELINGISAMRISFQPDYEESMKRLYKKALNLEFLDMTEPLEIDFETCKPIRHNINWPKTENLK